MRSLESHQPVVITARQLERLRASGRSFDAEKTLTCPVCASIARWFCSLDFAVSGNDYFAGSRTFADTGVEAQYFRCEECEFMFSPFFWGFSQEDFRALIYNESYLLADPPFAHDRPMRDARCVAALLGDKFREAHLLDFGGGEGKFAGFMRQLGYPNCVAYDPIHGGVEPSPHSFDIVTCFEVIEHVIPQAEFAKTIRNLLSPAGFVVLSTQVQPQDVVSQGKHWWYIEPRNGHLSIHSENSLKLLFGREQIKVVRLCQDLVLLHPNAMNSRDLAYLEQRTATFHICSERNPLPGG
jgi:SAM-dependent methyltransferase